MLRLIRISRFSRSTPRTSIAKVVGTPSSVSVEIVDDPGLQREEFEIYSLDGERNLKAAFE